MPRGGSRAGAGRKKGTVAPSKVTQIRQQMIAKAVHNSLTPLDYMLSILRDETKDWKDRLKAAVDAAPYIHPKLSNMQHSGDPENPLETITRIELVAGNGHRSD